MNKSLSKKEARKESLKKIGYAVGTAAMTASTFVPMAFAAGATGPAKTVIETFLAYVLDMFLCVGVLLGVWSVAQLALSFKNEDADSKSKAMMMLVVSCVLIGIKPLATTIINASGVTWSLSGKGFLT